MIEVTERPPAALIPRERSVSILGATGSIGSSTIDLLKREPDPTGWSQYLGSLESGRLNKIDILASLHYSPEGQRARVKIMGLAWPANIDLAS